MGYSSGRHPGSARRNRLCGGGGSTSPILRGCWVRVHLTNVTPGNHHHRKRLTASQSVSNTRLLMNTADACYLRRLYVLVYLLPKDSMVWVLSSIIPSLSTDSRLTRTRHLCPTEQVTAPIPGASKARVIYLPVSLEDDPVFPYFYTISTMRIGKGAFFGSYMPPPPPMEFIKCKYGLATTLVLT